MPEGKGFQCKLLLQEDKFKFSLMFYEFNTFVFVGLHSVQTNKKRSVKNNYKLAMYSRHQMFIVDFCILTQVPMDV